MGLLRAEPMSEVRNVPELRSLACAMSRQAIELYQTLMERMAEFGNADAGAAFARILSLEREQAPPDEAPWPDDLPDVLDNEELGTSRLVTPYLAYGLAARNVERLFALWTYVAANASDPAVLAEAERLARVAGERLSVLRAERRRAFHISRPQTATARDLRTVSLEEFGRQAGSTEADLAQLHRRVAEVLADAGDRRATLFARIADEEAENAQGLGADLVPGAARERLPDAAGELSDLATERLEAAVELYLSVAEASLHDDVVSMAQDLADRAITRLTSLR